MNAAAPLVALTRHARICTARSLAIVLAVSQAILVRKVSLQHILRIMCRCTCSLTEIPLPKPHSTCNGSECYVGFKVFDWCIYEFVLEWLNMTIGLLQVLRMHSRWFGMKYTQHLVS